LELLKHCCKDFIVADLFVFSGYRHDNHVYTIP
jgi:hypothetical protein